MSIIAFIAAWLLLVPIALVLVAVATSADRREALIEAALAASRPWRS